MELSGAIGTDNAAPLCQGLLAFTAGGHSLLPPAEIEKVYPFEQICPARRAPVPHETTVGGGDDGVFGYPHDECGLRHVQDIVETPRNVWFRVEAGVAGELQAEVVFVYPDLAAV